MYKASLGGTCRQRNEKVAPDTYLGIRQCISMISKNKLKGIKVTWKPMIPSPKKVWIKVTWAPAASWAKVEWKSEMTFSKSIAQNVGLCLLLEFQLNAQWAVSIFGQIFTSVKMTNSFCYPHEALWVHGTKAAQIWVALFCEVKTRKRDRTTPKCWVIFDNKQNKSIIYFAQSTACRIYITTKKAPKRTRWG